MRWMCLIAASLVAVGCSSGNPFDCVPVKGKVVFEDGSPLTTGKLFFRPLAPAQGTAHPHAGMADLASDGTFDSATTYKYGDGLIRGKHKVSIAYATDAQGNSLVARDYLDMMTTPVEIDTADSPLTITVKKPAKPFKP
jgi:hypothetical protein